MGIKNLSQLKKYLANEGVTIKLTYSYYAGHKYLNIPRKVIKYQTNGVQFEGGSWLMFDKADKYVFSENCFSFLDEGRVFLTYEYIKE